MAPAHILFAQDGIRPTADFVADADPEPEPQNPAPAVLFVGKRATARQLKATFSIRDSELLTSRDAVLEARIGSEKQVHFAVVTSQRAALQRVKTDPPRAVVVEVDNRPQSRVRFCRMLRSRVPAMAIFAAGDRPPESAFVFDDFLTLPLAEEEVISAVARLRDRFLPHAIQCGPFRLNLATRVVHTPKGPRHMTPKLCALLELLMLRHDEVISRGEIMKSIWETSYLEDTRTLDVHIRWLRECIEPDPYNPVYLLTERGTGYIFQTRERLPDGSYGSDYV
jgi:DNA-binding response OmpR family regulator